MLLDQAYCRLHGRGLASVVEDITGSTPIAIALRIITEGHYHHPAEPVNIALVDRDVDLLIELRRAGLPDPATLLSTLCRRSHTHIRQVAVRYRLKRGIDMDRDFRTCAMFTQETRAVVVHIIRSALDPTYRDVMLLKDALRKSDPTLMAVRMTRMHWYPQHWHQVKSQYMGICGEHLIERMNSRYNGLFRDLMVTMAQVPVVGSF